MLGLKFTNNTVNAGSPLTGIGSITALGGGLHAERYSCATLTFECVENFRSLPTTSPSSSASNNKKNSNSYKTCFEQTLVLFGKPPAVAAAANTPLVNSGSNNSEQQQQQQQHDGAAEGEMENDSFAAMKIKKSSERFREKKLASNSSFGSAAAGSVAGGIDLFIFDDKKTHKHTFPFSFVVPRWSPPSISSARSSFDNSCWDIEHRVIFKLYDEKQVQKEMETYKFFVKHPMPRRQVESQPELLKTEFKEFSRAFMVCCKQSLGSATMKVKIPRPIFFRPSISDFAASLHQNKNDAGGGGGFASPFEKSSHITSVDVEVDHSGCELKPSSMEVALMYNLMSGCDLMSGDCNVFELFSEEKTHLVDSAAAAAAAAVGNNGGGGDSTSANNVTTCSFEVDTTAFLLSSSSSLNATGAAAEDNDEMKRAHNEPTTPPAAAQHHKDDDNSDSRGARSSHFGNVIRRELTTQEEDKTPTVDEVDRQFPVSFTNMSTVAAASRTDEICTLVVRVVFSSSSSSAEEKEGSSGKNEEMMCLSLPVLLCAEGNNNSGGIDDTNTCSPIHLNQKLQPDVADREKVFKSVDYMKPGVSSTGLPSWGCYPAEAAMATNYVPAVKFELESREVFEAL